MYFMFVKVSGYKSIIKNCNSFFLDVDLETTKIGYTFCLYSP